jgi:hypothetical protein
MCEVISECPREGYGEYRTYILFADLVAETYNWNNNALMRFNETIKDALDPNGILASGRNCIWPSIMERGGGYWEIGLRRLSVEARYLQTLEVVVLGT